MPPAWKPLRLKSNRLCGDASRLKRACNRELRSNVSDCARRALYGSSRPSLVRLHAGWAPPCATGANRDATDALEKNKRLAVV